MLKKENLMLSSSDAPEPGFHKAILTFGHNGTGVTSNIQWGFKRNSFGSLVPDLGVENLYFTLDNIVADYPFYIEGKRYNPGTYSYNGEIKYIETSQEVWVGGGVIRSLARYLKESFKNFGGFWYAEQRGFTSKQLRASNGLENTGKKTVRDVWSNQCSTNYTFWRGSFFKSFYDRCRFSRLYDNTPCYSDRFRHILYRTVRYKRNLSSKRSLYWRRSWRTLLDRLRFSSGYYSLASNYERRCWKNNNGLLPSGISNATFFLEVT